MRVPWHECSFESVSTSDDCGVYRTDLEVEIGLRNRSKCRGIGNSERYLSLGRDGAPEAMCVATVTSSVRKTPHPPDIVHSVLLLAIFYSVTYDNGWGQSG